jgi:ferredoxin-type protein NapH
VPRRVTPLIRNRLTRAGFFFVGIALFYGPFAFAFRALGSLFPGTYAANTVVDVHTACMRMPIGWLVQPWMYSSIGVNALYFVPIVVLPLAAVVASPLFCGWLCPTGTFPEYVSRLVPDRFKFDLHGKVPIVPLRYGFLVGLLVAPFLTASICCSYCNFTQMQNITSFVAGDTAPLLFVGTTGVITMALWLVVLGLFMKGGRGWCMLLCPAGALMSLASGVTSRIRRLPRVRHDSESCASCASCVDVCPVRAVDVDEAGVVKVGQYLCNGCMDCVKACPSGAMRFGSAR